MSDFIACNETNYRKGRTKAIKYIVIHYTANNGDTAKNNADYFAKNKNLGSSAHYFVDENSVCQSVKEGDTAWHCGASSYKHKECRNDNSIGIELCSRKDGSGNYYFLNEVFNNAAELTRELMKKYSVTADRVIRHFDVTGKICPAPFVNDESKWAAFKAELEDSMFKDISENDYAYKHIKKLKDYGIVNGDTEGNFNPDEPIKRRDVAVMLANLLSVLGK